MIDYDRYIDMTICRYVVLCVNRFAFFCIAIDGPDSRHGDGHRKANRQQLHRVPGKELTVDDMVHDQHDTAAPEHELQGLEVTTDEGVVLFGAKPIDRRYYRLR